MYATNRPILNTPSNIWIMPARITMLKASTRFSGPARVTTAAMATAIGPVGPEIWDLVPPNTAAKNPTAIAP